MDHFGRHPQRPKPWIFKAKRKAAQTKWALNQNSACVPSVASFVLLPYQSRLFVDGACKIKCPYWIRLQKEWPFTMAFHFKRCYMTCAIDQLIMTLSEEEHSWS